MEEPKQETSPSQLLARGLGIAIRDRRRELTLSGTELGRAIGLSASYYRSLEAGSITPPPSIAISLAQSLGWDIGSTCELLCVISDLRDEGPDLGSVAKVRARIRVLSIKGVLPAILAALNRSKPEEVSEAIRAKLEEAKFPTLTSNASTVGDRNIEDRLPWMVGLAVRNLTQHFSRVPFSFDLAYVLDFELQQSKNIGQAIAVLSYLPVKSIWETSNTQFNFLMNEDLRPSFVVRYPKAISRDITDELIRSDALAALATRLGRVLRPERRRELSERLRAQLSMRPLSKAPAFHLDRTTNELVDNEGPNVTPFRNVWLFRLAAEQAWVGFADDFRLGHEADVRVAPLTLRDAARLAAEYA